MEILATNYFEGSKVNGILLYIPPVGTLIGNGDLLNICVWEYDLDAFLTVLSSEALPKEEWFSDEIVSCQMTGKCFIQQDFFRVDSHTKHVGARVDENEIIGTMSCSEAPENAGDWYNSRQDNLPSEELDRRKVKRFARNLGVALDTVCPEVAWQKVCEFDVLKVWLKENGFPTYK